MKQMLKRKDGSYSQRGLWDNIRANKGSGKAPTKEMLKQEKKIKMAKVKKAQTGAKYPSMQRFTTKNYDTKINKYPNGDSDTTVIFNPRGGKKFNIPSVGQKTNKMSKITKAQKGKKLTPMQELKKKYPTADTTKRGDLRFEDLGDIGRYSKKDQKRIADTEAAFNKKYGKNKPSLQKGGMLKKGSLKGKLIDSPIKKMKKTTGPYMAKKGVTIKKKMQAGGVAGMQPKAGMVDPNGAYTKVQMRTLGNMEYGGMMKAKGGKWIQKAIKKPGALRAQLGAKPGKPIPAGKLAKAAKAKGKLGQRARLAQTLKKMKKK